MCVGLQESVIFCCSNIIVFSVSKTNAIYMYIYIVKLGTVVEGDRKTPISIATTPMCKEGATTSPGLQHFTLDTYLIMLSVKPGGIKYHFLSLWYD